MLQYHVSPGVVAPDALAKADSLPTLLGGDYRIGVSDAPDGKVSSEWGRALGLLLLLPVGGWFTAAQRCGGRGSCLLALGACVCLGLAGFFTGVIIAVQVTLSGLFPGNKANITETLTVCSSQVRACADTQRPPLSPAHPFESCMTWCGAGQPSHLGR